MDNDKDYYRQERRVVKSVIFDEPDVGNIKEVFTRAHQRDQKDSTEPKGII